MSIAPPFADLIFVARCRVRPVVENWALPVDGMDAPPARCILAGLLNYLCRASIHQSTSFRCAPCLARPGLFLSLCRQSEAVFDQFAQVRDTPQASPPQAKAFGNQAARNVSQKGPLTYTEHRGSLRRIDGKRGECRSRVTWHNAPPSPSASQESDARLRHRKGIADRCGAPESSPPAPRGEARFAGHLIDSLPVQWVGMCFLFPCRFNRRGNCEKK